MICAWIFVLVVAMVHTRPKKTKRAHEESDSETESEEWNELLAENVAKVSAAAKGKAPATSSAADKGKGPAIRPKKSQARKSTSDRGIHIQEPIEEMFVTSERIKEFDGKECIGERHVDIKALKDRSPQFGILLERAGLEPICSFPETTGFCITMIRKFYQNASGLCDIEDGPKEFVTMVRNKRLVITPDLIGKVLGMQASVSGVHYLKGHVFNNTTWRTVVDAICLPDTQSAGNSILSKELRLEYKLLHYVVCYNILPNMNTKILRWDRMLFLYLIGNPAASMGSNFNIPYLIWSRMTKYLESTRSSERLPYPMIIMRIFRHLRIDTESTAYMHSLGTINDSTFVKSIATRQDDAPTPPRHGRQAPAASAAATTSTSASASEEPSMTSVYREQRRLSAELAGISGRLETIEKKQSSLMKMVKKLLNSLGCSGSEGSP